MSGIFRATSWPQLNLEPQAWGEGSAGSSRYPLQVRVRLETDAVLQVGEDRLRSLLEYRGSHNRFDMQLSKAHAEALALLFSQYGQPRSSVAPGPFLLGQTMQQLGVGGGRPMSGPSGERTSGGGGERQWKNGVIFICDSSTEQECISRRLLGLPKSQTSLLSKMGDSSFLFLFNVRSRQLLGVLRPDGPAGMDLEPSAWGGGRFPVQVRFRPASPSGQVRGTRRSHPVAPIARTTLGRRRPRRPRRRRRSSAAPLLPRPSQYPDLPRTCRRAGRSR